ncbi:hypothetical protein BV898_00595 [Hypsibius exemplaris]|uniref:Uncharacterized protein n=1 Tax=Hypsibius exemplaris TaxID=2072580 RepID=A0A1W0XDW9_HYPEX|nr:hypothetical protein BV898_00595 [Hypsibius exemplaris]
MLKVFLVVILAGVATCETNKLAGKFVWGLLKPALSAAEVNTIIGSRDPGYPTYHSIPDTKFSCASKAQPGNSTVKWRPNGKSSTVATRPET